MFTTC